MCPKLVNDDDSPHMPDANADTCDGSGVTVYAVGMRCPVRRSTTRCGDGNDVQIRVAGPEQPCLTSAA